ncbi:MAG: hypothetical protein H0W12_02465 [Chitinophagaceae bacterium]|nr:hypothetical protein [Chitinophagaceae bacterium]
MFKKNLTVALGFFFFAFLTTVKADAQLSGVTSYDPTTDQRNMSAAETDQQLTQPGVRFDIAKLQALLQQYVANGLKEITFTFSTVRAQDTAKYFAANPDLTISQRLQVVDKPTILLKVPSYVMKKWQKTTDARATSTSNVFVDMAKICPPPASCN